MWEILLYRFHYDFYLRLFQNARLIFTDTDSLYFYVEHDNAEKILYENRAQLDFSDYPEGHPYKNNANRMVLGKFKCETRGEPIVEIVCLKPKMYSYLFKKDKDTNQLIEKRKIKGVSRAAAKLLRHQMYLDQLTDAKENYLTNRRIGNRLNIMYSIEVCKTRKKIIIFANMPLYCTWFLK